MKVNRRERRPAIQQTPLTRRCNHQQVNCFVFNAQVPPSGICAASVCFEVSGKLNRWRSSSVCSRPAMRYPRQSPRKRRRYLHVMGRRGITSAGCCKSASPTARPHFCPSATLLRWLWAIHVMGAFRQQSSSLLAVSCSMR